MRIIGLISAALGCLLIVMLGVYLQSQVHVNHDVAWIAHSAAWMLDGRRFGSDILDPNPPMAWFLMLPAAMAARAGILPEIIAVQAWSWLLACAGVALSFRVLVPLGRYFGRVEVIGLLVATSAVVSILPVGNFGQRDVIAFGLMLPYLFTLMGRLGAAQAPGRVLAVVVGLSAGISFCLKPHLLAVPLLAEGLNLLLTRNFRALLRVEIVAMGLAVLAYPLSILAFAPDYLADALPLIRAAYWAYEGSDYLVLERFKDAVLPCLYAVGIAIATASFSRAHGLLVSAAAGFSLSYWLQYKGFPYHAYPILATGCLLLVYSVICAVRNVLRSTWVTRSALRILISGVVLLVAIPILLAPFRVAGEWYQAADRQHGDWGREREAPIRRLATLGIRPSDYIYAFSTHPNPGFPTVNYLGVQWAGRAVAQFVIPAYVRMSEVTDPEMREAINRATAIQIELVVADLARHRPAYVMVEARQRRLGLAYRRFDDIAFYTRDEKFSRLWNCYEEIEPVGNIRLFKLRNACVAG